MSAQVAAPAPYPADTRNPASWTPEQRKAFRMDVSGATAESEYRVGADGLTAVVIVDKPGNLVARGFRGKKLKAAFAYRFQSAEHRERHVSEWLADADRMASEQAAWRAEVKAKHTLKAGDILFSSWGYDQTNVAFYEVINVRGACVDLQELKQDRTETGFMCGRCSALAGQYTGPLIVGKRPNGRNRIRICSSESVSPWDGTPKNWSSYA